jgi:dolichol-phosphate mannosyltransferase
MTLNKVPHLSVIVPIFNEEQVIPELYQRIQNTISQITSDYEILFVNDGSSDLSLHQLQELAANDSNVIYLDFSRNFGHQIAVTAGLEHCRGEIVVIIDGDLQDPPELISQMYEKHKEGFDVVYAKRNSRKGESPLKKLTATLFYRILQKITSVKIPVDTGDYRLMHRKVVDNLNRMPEKNKFLRGQIAWLGFRQAEVLFDRDERKFGTTGYSYSKMFQFALDGITGFSDKPLQFVTKLGFTISLVSFFIILYALYSHFVLHQTITGWTSLIMSSMFIGGVQLFSIGIIGEYISRINTNVRNRPLYVVRESNTEPEEIENYS